MLSLGTEALRSCPGESCCFPGKGDSRDGSVPGVSSRYMETNLVSVHCGFSRTVLILKILCY